MLHLFIKRAMGFSHGFVKELGNSPSSFIVSITKT
jgi:hypothetical protein